MISIRRALLSAGIATALLGAAASAQPPPVAPSTTAGATAPPQVLSTTPSPPAGVVPEPGQMSGLPLQVGDLPPGIVAVRVVRRSFSENVANQAVELRLPATNRSLKAVTNGDGRAQFGSISVGETVQVHTSVDGEVLESQPFELPARGGVRVVLVAGVGAGSPGNASGSPSSAPTLDTGTAAATVRQPSASPSVVERIGAGPILMFLFAMAAAGVLWWKQPRRVNRVAAASRPTRPPPRPTTRPLRADVFESLVQLEKDFAAARVDPSAYQTRREALIAELVSMDLTTGS